MDRIDWDAYECRCGERGHIGRDLRRIIPALSVAEMEGATLDGHVEFQETLAPVAVPVVGVIMAALQEDLSAAARDELVFALWRIVLGEGYDDLSADIHARVRDNIWAVYREAARGDTEAALDILEYVERDRARLEHFRRAVAPRLAKRARRSRPAC